MKRISLALCFLLSLAVGMSGCMNDDNQDEQKIVENEAAIEAYIKADSLASKAIRDSIGLYYITRKANPNGLRPKLGDAATVKFTGYLLANNTKVLSIPGDSSFSFPVGGGATGLPGFERTAFLMKTGEKATFLLPFYLAFGQIERVNIPAYSAIRLEIELIKTRTEIQQIDDFIAKKGFKVSERTAENLVIIRTNTVTGDTTGVGKSVNVKYTGKFLSDTKFDEGTIPLTTGAGSVIPGFDKAVRKMRKGEKAIVVFPSPLGYKTTGYKTIPPYTVLQFELEIL
ncbi:MAG: FKBP-type peptidyl-prolyl cis-trans isomerase [Dyadobacter sp.]|uniref:FKBP-type peptidyl-prolyl cis-trans isomerase n=1 Tax=Dyadobacter sp. TaxID=1914288 RepID=UPI003263D26E